MRSAFPPVCHLREPRRAIRDSNFSFLFAPHYHPAMKSVAPVRKALGVSTLFNLLGPLTNPARVPTQVVGVFHPSRTRFMAEALLRLGVEPGPRYFGGMRS